MWQQAVGERVELDLDHFHKPSLDAFTFQAFQCAARLVVRQAGRVVKPLEEHGQQSAEYLVVRLFGRCAELRDQPDAVLGEQMSFLQCHSVLRFVGGQAESLRI